MDQQPRIAVTLREAAALTGLSVDTLRRFIRRGQLASVRIGGRVMLRIVVIEQFIKDHEAPGGRRRVS